MPQPPSMAMNQEHPPSPLGPCLQTDMISPPCSCSTGYINHSLSVFRIQDLEPYTKLPETLPGFLSNEIKECR